MSLRDISAPVTPPSPSYRQCQLSNWLSSCYCYPQFANEPFLPDPAPFRVYFENRQPILRVEDIKGALAFYVERLGFQNASWGMGGFTSVNRDRGGQGRGGANVHGG